LKGSRLAVAALFQVVQQGQWGLSKKLSKNGNSKFFASRKLYKNAFTGKAAHY
jgi:hypothetical protein